MLHVIQLTPPGRGAVATLRIEGPGAVEAVEARFHTRSGRPLRKYATDRLVIGQFGLGGERHTECACYSDHAEEVVVRRHADAAVDMHCHGGTAAIARIEESLVAAGCRRLTCRQWAVGHYADPIAAAALVALADVRTERAAAILLDQYHGALRQSLAEIRQAIDRGDCRTARRQIDTLLARAELGRHLVQPWQVVLAGPVNAGKSSLMNALAGYDRAIVHATPGTTRDAVTVATAIDGWPVELCDTAGLRQTADPLEHAGIELANSRLAAADLAILVFDRSQPWSEANQCLIQEWPQALVVHNKCDLPTASGQRPAGLVLSALDGRGINELLDAIAGRLVPDPPPPGAAVPFMPEQVQAARLLMQEALGGTL